MSDEKKDTKFDLPGMIEAAHGFFQSSQFKDWSDNMQKMLNSPEMKAARDKGKQMSEAAAELAKQYEPKLQEIARVVESASAFVGSPAPARGNLQAGQRVRVREPVDFAREQGRLVADLHGSLIVSGRRRREDLSFTPEEVTSHIAHLCDLRPEQVQSVNAAAKEAYDKTLGEYLDE